MHRRLRRYRYIIQCERFLWDLTPQLNLIVGVEKEEGVLGKEDYRCKER